MRDLVLSAPCTLFDPYRLVRVPVSTPHFSQFQNTNTAYSSLLLRPTLSSRRSVGHADTRRAAACGTAARAATPGAAPPRAGAGGAAGKPWRIRETGRLSSNAAGCARCGARRTLPLQTVDPSAAVSPRPASRKPTHFTKLSPGRREGASPRCCERRAAIWARGWATWM